MRAAVSGSRPTLRRERKVILFRASRAAKTPGSPFLMPGLQVLRMCSKYFENLEKRSGASASFVSSA